MDRKKLSIIIVILIIIFTMLVNIIKNNNTQELRSIRSEKQLISIYNEREDDVNIPALLGTMPFGYIKKAGDSRIRSLHRTASPNSVGNAIDGISADSTATSSSKKDYSTTNIQVENVDEADITKTDGKYIYSISEKNVIITNVEDPSNMEVVAKLDAGDYIPEDIILYENKLAVISTGDSTAEKNNTKVKIFDVTNKSAISTTEEYILYSKYYTSRCINGKLIVICSGDMRVIDDKIVTYYNENNIQKDIGLNNIKYLKDKKESYQTIISSIDLNKNESVQVSEYLFDIQNAYVSENNVYLLNENYEQKTGVWKEIKNLLLKGVIKYIKDSYDDDYDDEKYTTIYKFKINKDGTLSYQRKAKIKGTTINQFSTDEYNNNLRIAVQGDEGSRIVIFDESLRQIGNTQYLSKGEKMYSTRFLENKAYMVTYKNTDPLYVIDLSNPKSPNVLGELKIPGYSTYLHPYDENHLIGIGMQTEENIIRDSSGKVTRTSAKITGMKMALFDVSDVSNPIQISQTIIGDSNTTSAILENHKALLFSKEKEIIAIPVNSYPSTFEITLSDKNDVSKMETLYTNYDMKYTSEGYFVYNINLSDGFKLKGVIEHQKQQSKYSYSFNYSGKLLRGLWIKNNIFTVSEDMIKVNNLSDLSQISEIKINNR